jgi:hypothetical protein
MGESASARRGSSEELRDCIGEINKRVWNIKVSPLLTRKLVVVVAVASENCGLLELIGHGSALLVLTRQCTVPGLQARRV